MASCYIYNGHENILGLTPEFGGQPHKYTTAEIYKIMKDYIFDPANSNDPLVKAVKARLFSSLEDTIKKLKELDAVGAKLTKDTSIGVSDLITTEWTFENEKFRMTPEYLLDERIAHMPLLKNMSLENKDKIIDAIINSDPDGIPTNKSLNDIKILIELQLIEEQEIAPIGEHIHAIIQYLFAAKGNINDKKVLDELQSLIDEIGTEKKPGKLYEAALKDSRLKDPGGIKVAILGNGKDKEGLAVQVYKTITTKYGEDAQYLTETWVSAAQNKLTAEAAQLLPKAIRGRIDLIVVKKDGLIDVLDFKTSTREFKNWYAAKRYHTEYQLGFYRALLAANGFDPRKIGLYCMPIFMRRGDIGKMHLDQFTDNNPIKNMLIPTSQYENSHLDLREGKFMKRINKFIFEGPTQDIDEKTPEVEDIEAQVGKIVNPFEQQSKTVSREELLEHHVFPTNGKVPGFRMWDYIQGKWMYGQTMEAFSKEGGIVDNYIQRLKTKNQDLIIGLSKEVDEYIENPDGDITKLKDFLNQKESNLNVHQVISKNLSRYCDGNWSRVQSDKLLSFGILAFQHNTTKTIEFIVLTNLPLTPTIKNELGETVLGKFMKNRDIERDYPGLRIMDSTVANLHLIKAATVINSMADEIFNSGQTLGDIVVINYTQGEAVPCDLSQLQENFEIAAVKAGLQNKFGQLHITNFWQQACNQLSAIIRPDESVTTESEKNMFVWEEEVKKMVHELDPSEDEKSIIIEQIQRLMLMMRRKYGDQIVRESVEIAWNQQTEPQIVYGILAKTLARYTDTDVLVTGHVNKYGISGSEFLRYLTTPFFKDAGETYRDKLGNEYVGVGQGTYMSTPTTVVSDNLKRLYEHFTEAFLAVRKDFNKQAQYITTITKEFEDQQVSRARRVGLGYVDDVWEDLIVKENDGKHFAQVFQVKNPFQDNIDLDESQQLFLKRWLWEVNKYILGVSEDLKRLHWDGNEERILSDKKISKAIDEGYYFDIPLRRARSFQELKNLDKIGVLEYFGKKWEHLQDEIDDRRLNSTIREEVDKKQNKDYVQLVNPYDFSSTLKNKNLRQKMIEEQGVYDYEVDLNLLALDVSYNYIKLDKFVPLLLTADAFAVEAQEIAAKTGLDFSTELDALHKYIDSVVLGKSIIDPEAHGLSKTISTLRRINSFMHLAGRPLQFVKEMTVGTFTNFSRAWANSGQSGKFKMKSLAKGYEIVFGMGLHKFGSSLIGESDWADFTMVLQLNHEYGLANDDMNTMVIKRKFNRHGIIAGASNMLYLANTAPDFYNRMVLFIALMDSDGCLDAHSLDDDGNLNYDFSKDKRFNKLKCTGDNVVAIDGDEKDKEYLEQKALYRAMMSEFIKSETTTDDGKPLKYGMELPRAYTVKQRQSIKEVANLAYGFYDHEEKSLMDNMFIGLVWKQFMTFWTAKLTLWGKGRNKHTAQGQFKAKKDANGNQLYFHIVTDAQGHMLNTEEVTYDKDEEGNVLEPVYEWEGEYTEGLMYSIAYTLKDVLHGNFKELWLNKLRRGNMKLALHDILLGIILLNILKAIATGGTGKKKDVDPAWQYLYMTMYRALQEFDPINSLGSINWEPSFASTLSRAREDTGKLLTGDYTLGKFFQRNFGAVSDFTIEE